MQIHVILRAPFLAYCELDYPSYYVETIKIVKDIAIADYSTYL